MNWSNFRTISLLNIQSFIYFISVTCDLYRDIGSLYLRTTLLHICLYPRRLPEPCSSFCMYYSVMNTTIITGANYLSNSQRLLQLQPVESSYSMVHVFSNLGSSEFFLSASLTHECHLEHREILLLSGKSIPYRNRT